MVRRSCDEEVCVVTTNYLTILPVIHLYNMCATYLYIHVTHRRREVLRVCV